MKKNIRNINIIAEYTEVSELSKILQKILKKIRLRETSYKCPEYNFNIYSEWTGVVNFEEEVFNNGKIKTINGKTYLTIMSKF